MADIKKVVKGFPKDCPKDCPYLYRCDQDGEMSSVCSMLAVQVADSDAAGFWRKCPIETKKVIDIAPSDYIVGIVSGKCPQCGGRIATSEALKTKFCKFCGQAVTWDD